MNYVLYGENETELEKFIDKIIKEENIENKVTYNYKECEIEDVLEECSYLDLFGSKKIVILNDCEFLTTKSTLENKALENYIENPNENTTLIFKIIAEKLDERKKLVKLLKSKVTIKEFKPLDESNTTTYIKKYFENLEFEIDMNSVKEIEERLKSNTKVIDRELEKLYLYRINEKNISLDDVKNVITKYSENNIFELVEAVVKNDKQKIFTLYKELIEEKEEPAVIVSLLAGQFRLLYQVNILAEQGMDSTKIASKLGVHPYRVTLAIKASHNIEEKKMLNILESLANVDKSIKLGLTDKTKALETFFLEL